MIENLPSKSSDDPLNTNKLAIFQGKKIRKIIFNNEWWFSVIDVIEILTGSSIPKRYWSDLKKKLKAEGYVEAYENIVRLKMLAPDGKMRDTDCANTETMLRIIQSIPSPKAEPLKTCRQLLARPLLMKIGSPVRLWRRYFQMQSANP